MTELSKRGFGERLQPWAVLVATVVIPAAIAWTNVRSEEQKLKLEYVRVAISVLQEPPPPRPPDGAPLPHPKANLREWAVTVLNQSSPVPIKEDVRFKLIDGSMVFPELRSNNPWQGGLGDADHASGDDAASESVPKTGNPTASEGDDSK